MSERLKQLLARIQANKDIGKGKQVVVGLSGGVDSAMAAYLLQQQGYTVAVAFMKNWSDTKNEVTGECAWQEERKVAIEVAEKLGLKLLTFDFEDEYKKDVVDPMFEGYKKGLTPNPDVLCNQKVKFPLFYERAKELGAEYIAMGHYVRRVPEHGKAGTYKLLRGVQEEKDQSYFLYRLSQEELSYSLFPVGYYTKEEIRFMAEELGFSNYDKRSTRGICFIGKVNLKEFLQQKIPAKKGNMITPEGKVVGEHDGIMYYTIGQRVGPRFGIEVQRKQGEESTQRWYVAAKDVEKNEIIVAPEGHEALYRKEVAVTDDDFHFIGEENMPKKVMARIRHVGELLPATVHHDKEKELFIITLDEAITGVAQGQSVVLYDNDTVIGGGDIIFPQTKDLKITP